MKNKKNDIRPVVNDKPYPIPIEMRPIWRISLIIISIIVVSGKKKYLDLTKVNILVWMLIRNNRWDEYEDFLISASKEVPLISVDTATFKAVEFSMARNLIELKDGRLYITKSGEEYYSLLVKHEILQDEIDYLTRVGKKLTDSKIKCLTGKIA